MFGQVTVPLGMDQFGQSGERSDLYGYAGIDAGHIVNAALLALEGDRSTNSPLAELPLPEGEAEGLAGSARGQA